MTFFRKVVSKLEHSCFPLEVGYLIIVVNFVYKWARQLISGHYKRMSEWFIFSEYFSIGGLILLWSHGCTIFQSRIPKWLQSSSKVVNTCDDNNRRQTVPVLKQYLIKLDIKPSRLVLRVLAWCENHTHRLEQLLKWLKWLKLNNSSVHSSFDRSELYLSTCNQSWKYRWKQEEDGSG